LLYSSHLETLIGAIKTDLSKFEDKAIQSNPSEVTNISNYLPNLISVEEFSDFLFDEIRETNHEAMDYDLNPEDLEAILKLRNEKYQTWEWIFGYSPRYRFTNKLKSGESDIYISLLVERGIISELYIAGAIAEEFRQKLISILTGCRHEFEAVKSSLFKLNDLFQVHGISIEGFLNTMF
jgi:lipoate-protein ligase A